MGIMSAVPVDKELYQKAKRKAKRTYKVWPSAYASGYLVKEYKRMFADKYGKKRNPYTQSGGGNRSTGGLTRWFDEEWVNVCEKDDDGNYKPCGRNNASINAEKYPYCRPLKRVNRKTPKTVGELTKKQRNQMCKKKRKSMRRRRSNEKAPTRVFV